MAFVREQKVEKPKKEWTKESIKELLATNDLAVERGILAIYNRQTLSEQTTESTFCRNGVGFNAMDSNILSSYAKWILSGNHLTYKQMFVARKKLPKYARQLLEVIEEKRQ